MLSDTSERVIDVTISRPNAYTAITHKMVIPQEIRIDCLTPEIILSYFFAP